jgi:hypothetical protein
MSLIKIIGSGTTTFPGEYFEIEAKYLSEAGDLNLNFKVTGIPVNIDNPYYFNPHNYASLKITNRRLSYTTNEIVSYGTYNLRDFSEGTLKGVQLITTADIIKTDGTPVQCDVLLSIYDHFEVDPGQADYITISFYDDYGNLEQSSLQLNLDDGVIKIR